MYMNQNLDELFTNDKLYISLKYLIYYSFDDFEFLYNTSENTLLVPEVPIN